MTSDHWASYYRSGALVSCPTNPEPYYTMEVRDAWVRFFAALADGDRVLDIGTGNGPVALIARQTAEENTRSYRIDGVDLAATESPSRKFAVIGVSMISPEGLAIRPRMPAS